MKRKSYVVEFSIDKEKIKKFFNVKEHAKRFARMVKGKLLTYIDERQAKVDNTTNDVATAATEVIIEVMDGTIDYESIRTNARTIGELRAEKNFAGRLAVGGVLAEDTTPLSAGDRVVHQTANKKGGC